jgi:Xaa-Pro aminopeptidase
MGFMRYLFLAALAAFSLHGQSQPWYQSDFPAQEFRARHSKLYDKIGNQAVAVVQGVSLTPGFNMPRQTNEFYYLCGLETPHSYLLLDGRSRKTTLFVPPRNRRLEATEGRVLSADDAARLKELTGADDVQDTEVMRTGNWLNTVPGQALPTIYTLFSPGEGSAQNRFELQAANTALLNDA